MARIIGINRTQDGSISLFDSGIHKFSIHKERLTRKKHHWGKLGDLQLYLDYAPILKSKPIDLLVQCFSSDKELINCKIYTEEIKEKFNLKEHQIKNISHHLAHAYSAFYPSYFEDAAILIMDSVGSRVSNITEEVSQFKLNSEEYEVLSIYHGTNDGVKCISKQTWDGNKLKPAGLGQFYFFLTQCFFKGEGNEGKVMGLSSYGDPKKLDLPDLIVENGHLYIPEEWTEIFKDKDSFDFYYGSNTFQQRANLAAKGQEVFEKALIKLAKWAIKKTGAKKICYAGGCALNCVANSRLIQLLEFDNVFIPPAPHDGGTSIGCAIYGAIHTQPNKYNFNWKTDYLGLTEQTEPSTHIAKYTDLSISKPVNIHRKIANIIEAGHIISLFQNKSEFGPRALGHRSLIGNAKYEITKNYINSIVKNREWFRPIAPIVLEEDVNEYFEFKGKSPHMLFVANIKTEYYSKFKAIEHIDFTSRIQTVSAEEDMFLYNLLLEYKSLTGNGILTNTSLNGENEPIVESLSNAIEFLRKHKINYLIYPPYIIEKVDKCNSTLDFKSIKKLILS